MYWRYWSTNLWLNLGWQLAHWRRRFALFWYGGDKTPWLFVSIAVFVVAALGLGLRSPLAYHDGPRRLGTAFRHPLPGRGAQARARISSAEPDLPRAERLFRGARRADRGPV